MRALLLSLVVALPIAAAEPYEVYAIRYATIREFPVSALVKGAEAGRKLDIAMMVWLVRGNGRNILVDSGFHRPALFKDWKIDGFVRPDEAVARAGVRAEDITDIVLTHGHWDHAGGMDLFPKATIWIQRDEYAYDTGDAWQEGGKHGGLDREDLAFLLRTNLDGRLQLVDGDLEVLPGIRVFIGGKHTWQSQYVTVAARPGTVVIASDNLYLYENLEKRAPIAQTFDEASNLRAQERMRELATEPRLIVPGHDPAVMTRFPKVKESVVRIE